MRPKLNFCLGASPDAQTLAMTGQMGKCLRGMSNIHKAVIPAAGLGTRFLPATLSVPKEMLPLVDKPTILFNAEELIAADIGELILITGEGKEAILEFFGAPNKVEEALERAGKSELLKPILDMRRRLRVIPVPQGQPLGLGHAVLCASQAVGREPFAVLLGDEIMLQRPGKPSGTAQLKKIFAETKTSVVAVMEVAAKDVVKYGIVDVNPQGTNLWTIQSVVEKPSVEQAPSRLALPGRYVFDNEIFACLREVKPGRGGEIQLTDGMTLLAQRKGMLATVLDADRFDAGDKLGFIQANIEIGLRHPEIGAALRQYLSERFGGK